MYKRQRVDWLVTVSLLLMVQMDINVAHADCSDLLASTELDPPVDINESCDYPSGNLRLAGMTINNHGRILSGMSVTIEGSEFNNYYQYYSIRYGGIVGADISRDIAGFGSGYLQVVGGSNNAGRFVNSGGLYNDLGNDVAIGVGGVLEGDGYLENFGIVSNRGRVNLGYVWSSYLGSGVENFGYILNSSGGQWNADVILNLAAVRKGTEVYGHLINQQDADWTVGVELYNFSGGTVDNHGVMTNRGVFINQGAFNNTGEFYDQESMYLQGNGTVQNDGEFLITNGGALYQTAGSLVNNGNLQFVDGSYSFTGGVIENYGAISGGDAGQFVSDGSGSISNSGLFNVSDGVSVGSFENHAGEANIGQDLTAQTIRNDGGAMNVRGEIVPAHLIELSAGSINASQIDLGSASEMSFTGGRLSVIRFYGDLVNAGGTLAPGNSPGMTDIAGNYEQLIDAVLEIEIGGLSRGVEYDYLNVQGSAALGGTLAVSLFDFGDGLFMPGAGDVFDIVSAETLIGRFDLFDPAILDDGLAWNLDYIYDDFGTDFVRLSVVAGPVPEPFSISLIGIGLYGLGFVRRRRRS